MNTNVFGVIYIGDTPHIVREEDLAKPGLRDRRFVPLRDFDLDDQEIKSLRSLLLTSSKDLDDIQAVNALLKLGRQLARNELSENSGHNNPGEDIEPWKQ